MNYDYKMEWHNGGIKAYFFEKPIVEQEEYNKKKEKERLLY